VSDAHTGTGANKDYLALGIAPLANASTDPAAGFSWIVKILPYIEETGLSNNIIQLSQQYRLGAFDPVISFSGDANTQGAHLSTAQLSVLRCPSFAGASDCLDENGLYSTMGSDRPWVGNYVALSGTHYKQTRSDGLVFENGGLVSGEGRNGKGRKIGELADGVSKTILITESKEENYSSWFDGESTWVTALVPPGQDENNQSRGGVQSDGVLPRDPNGSGLPAIAVGGDAGQGHAINLQNYGPMTGGQQRWWGPSSEHSGDVIAVSFADVHTKTVSRAVDPRVFASFVSANEGESVGEEEL
jgi:hypothetical protein